MSVFAIPASNTLNDLNPKNNPAINPVYPSTPEWMGTHANIIGAWCGACYGDDAGELWLPLSGGHADYAGNEPYKINLLADVPQWEMVRPPSGAIGNVLTTNDGQELSGVYSDGRPRSIHSYNKPVWVDGVGPAVAVVGNSAWSGQSGPRDYIQIDRQSGEVAVRKAFATLAVGQPAGLGACYDVTRHAVWARGVGSGCYMRIGINESSWTAVSAVLASSGAYGLCHIPEHDVIFAVRKSSTQSVIEIVDCTTGTVTTPGFVGTPAAEVAGAMQPRWVPELSAVALWDNDAPNAHKVTLMSPGSSLKTDHWTASVIEFSITDQPTAKTNQGTYGRFFYSKRLGGFGVINRTTDPIYFFPLR